MAIFNRNKEAQELGFGSKNYNNRVRFLGNNGQVNVHRAGQGIGNVDIYHWLITASKTSLVVIIISGYILINLVFAFIYYCVGPQNFGGMDADTHIQQFLNLFFSARKP